MKRPDLLVATVEDVLSIRFVDDPDDVQVYAKIMDKLRAVARNLPRPAT